MKVFKYIRRFWEIPGLEKRMLWKASMAVGYYSLLVYLIPLKYYSRLFRNKSADAIVNTNIQAYNAQARKTLRRISRLLPWPISCLVKSLTFKYLIESYGGTCTIVIEAFKDGAEKLQMHACITQGNVPVYLGRKNNSGKYLHIQEV